MNEDYERERARLSLLSEHAEARSVAFTDVDVTNSGRTFRGYAAVFDQETDLGEHTEEILRGAFRKAIPTSGNVPMLYDHNPGLPVLATLGAGTLRLEEDGKGLLVEADIAKHFIGDAVVAMVESGDIRGMSFGFIAGKGNSHIEQRGTKPHRRLVGFKRILDVSPTWDPAYDGTNAELRSLRALQMAESLEAMQQPLDGASQQNEDGAELPAVETDEDEAQAEAEVAQAEDVPSGASEARHLLAARKRRLQMLGVTLPRGL